MVRIALILLLAAAASAAQNTPAERREPQHTTDANQETLEVRDIKESSARDVGEALQNVSGVSKVRKGGIANDVVLRGFQQDNVNVFIDGARIHGACPNNMDPSASHVDFAEVERVEVVKGPFDVRNAGSAGGTISIVTRQEQAKGFRFVPAFATGSFGFYNPSVETSGAGRLFDFKSGYAFRSSNPYKDGSGRRFTSNANFKSQDQPAFRGHSGWGSFGFRPANAQRVEVTYSRQANDVTLYPYLMMDAVFDNADRATLKYALRNPFPHVLDLRIEGYGTKVNHLMNDARRTSSGTRPFSMETHAVTSALGGGVQAELPANVTVGAQVSHRTWNAFTTMASMSSVGTQNSIPDVAIDSFGIFADVERELTHRARIQSGFRFDHADSSAAFDATNFYLAYNGVRSREAIDNFASGNVRLTVTAPKGVELFAGIGSTARVPDPQERFFAFQRMSQDWIGNPAIESPRNTEADLGLTFRLRGASLRALGFRSSVTNYIALHRQRRVNDVPGITKPAAISYVNTNATLFGGEASLSVPLTKAFAVGAGASLTRGTKDLDPTRAINDADLSEMPPLKSWLQLRYGSRWWYAQVAANAVAAQRKVDMDLNEQPTPGYGTADVKFGVHHLRFDLNLGIDNIFNRYYYESFSYSRDPFRSGIKVAEPGREVFMSFAFRM